MPTLRAAIAAELRRLELFSHLSALPKWPDAHLKKIAAALQLDGQRLEVKPRGQRCDCGEVGHVEMSWPDRYTSQCPACGKAWLCFVENRAA